MLKGKNIVLLILIFMLSSVITGCWMGNSVIKDISIKYDTYDIDYEDTFELGKIKSIEIDGNVSQIKFHISENNNIKVHLFGNIKSNYEPELIINTNSNHVEIKTQKDNIINMSVKTNKLVLDVYLPKNYNEKLDVACVSGNIIIEDYILENIDLSSVSGDIEVNGISSNNINIDTVSGDITGNNLIANKVIECKSISGDIEVTGDIGKINLESTSGDINIESIKLNGDININTISGEIDLDIPNDSEFKLYVNTVSGELYTEDFHFSNIKTEKNKIEGTKGNGKYNVNIKTVSGDVDIY